MRAGPVEQLLLQPFDRFQVEMVGRLVQQQQIGLLKQDLSEQRPGALAAAQVRHLLGVLVLVEAQPAQHLADARLVGVAARHLEGGLRVAVFCQQRVIVAVAPARDIGQAVLQLGQRGALVAQPIEDVQHRGVQRLVARGRRILRQIPDGQPAPARDIARRRRLDPGQDAQQGRLARAVRAHKTDAVAGLDAHVDARKDVQRAESLAEPGSNQ